MSGVLIVAHHQRPEAAALATQAATWLQAHGHDVWMPTEDANVLGLHSLGSARPANEASLALALGGDGTMLRTVKLLGGASTPVIGVNVGVLGYLIEIEPAELISALTRWFDTSAKDWHIEERMMLEVALDRRDSDGNEVWKALNEVVLEKGTAGHTVRLNVAIDGVAFTSYAADGLIVATPTGSTAYSLSARGPIVSPTHRAMLLTPVSPHMLFDRALVLDPDELIAVTVDGYRPVEVTIDGQRVATLTEGDTVRCRPADATAQFVRFGPRQFHQILKSKFGLADR